jgi:hypothetical protein
MGTIADNLLLGSASAKASDPFFGNVKSLPRFYGVNGATTFSDSGPLGLTITGSSNAGDSVNLGTTKLLYGSTSAELRSAFSQSLRIGAAGGGWNDTASLNLGSSDWTFEGWFNLDSSEIVNAFAEFSSDVNNYTVRIIQQPSLGAGGAINTLVRTAAGLVAGGGDFVIATNTWYHIASTRSSGTIRTFVNGSLIGSTSTNAGSPVVGTAGRWKIGRTDASGHLFNGSVDSVRITVGTARYTAAFTPPSAAFPIT